MRRILLVLALLLAPVVASAQGYSGPPVMQAFQATGLSMPYTPGAITVGGYQQTVAAGSVTLFDNQVGPCAAPQFANCNIVYWNGGTTLAVTTSPNVAFAPGTMPIAYITTGGGAILTVVTSNLSMNAPDGAVIPPTVGLRLPVCNALLKQGCQQPLFGSLNGY